ncbi:iron ABC transporter substrate-binding protein [Asanoa iriomotensis]|uniref:Iron ABC transporter substrate-binding protein n=1 Tax=Asanoa iriomotensis TaxID=234613 RepID=A0ABQ4BZ05_9ACTN|nr:iron ABC transporter substrate-binding protein [Asanoa iriomotensis]GIF55753.1 iron ABC transporter substrate-binding protein [Asanoa iriomotensis]
MLLPLAFVAVLGTTACGDDLGEPGDKKLTVYSGRSEGLVKPILDRFQQETGIEVEVRYATTAAMATQLLEERDKTPADIFFSQDAGALGAVAKAGLVAELPAEVLAKVPDTYRSAQNLWVGVSGRSRVLAYNKDKVTVDQLPASVLEVTDPEWKGRLGVAPTNGSFQAFVTALRVQHGDAKTKEFLDGLKSNAAKIYENNVQIVADINDGKLDVGLVNHYYVYELAKEKGSTPEDLAAKLHFFPNGDTGALVNVAGVAVLEKAATDPDARALVDFLLGAEAQRHWAEETFEYPLVDGVSPPPGVPTLGEIVAPKIDLNDLDTLDVTTTMIKEAGLAG